MRHLSDLEDFRPKHRTRSSNFLTSMLLAGVALLLTSITVTGNRAMAGSLTQSASEGETLFQQKCAACHTLGGGRLIGPDLQGVFERRDLAWLKSFIAAPDQMLASGDPVAQQLLAENENIPMPNLALSQTEVDSLVAYLENPAGTAQLPAAAPQPIGQGDPDRGRLIFAGSQALGGAGPACISCHNVEGIAPLGGGSLGPDLTHVFQRYGDAGLASALQTLPFPTMQGVFVNRPLTAAEVADLHAFFLWVDGQAAQPRSFTLWFWAVGVVGAGVLYGMLAVFWPRQRLSLAEKIRRTA